MATSPTPVLAELTYAPLTPEEQLLVEQLVTEDDTPVDNIYSERQQHLLTDSLYASWPASGGHRPFIALANVGLFYGLRRPPYVPDVLVSLDVTLPTDIWSKGHRSYMLWEYGKLPEVVVEVVSNSIGGEDSTKLEGYARIGIQYYVIHDPEHHLSPQTLRVYELHPSGYVARPDTQLPQVGLALCLWQGTFADFEAIWLRWCTPDGVLLRTGSERAEQERLRAEQAEQRLAELAARLRALGIDPDV